MYGGQVRDNFYDNVQSFLEYKPNNVLRTKYAYNSDSSSWRSYNTSDNDMMFQWRSCYQWYSCSGWYTNHGV